MKKTRAFVMLGAAALTLLATAVPASAEVQKGDSFVHIAFAGNTVCSGWISSTSGDNWDEVYGKFHSSGPATACIGYLQRKRYNADGSLMYDWTRISDNYYLSGTQDASTGTHWNGTNAGTRICVKYTPTGESGCSEGVW